MGTGPCRPFTLLDALILVAFTAVGCLPLREFKAVTGQVDGLGFRVPRGVILALFSSPIALCWGIAILGLRLRRPRPKLRVAFTQVGVVLSNVASCLALFFAFAVMTSGYRGAGLVERWIDGLRLVGFGIVGSMLTMMMTSKVRPPENWIDLVGRMVAIYWVMVAILLTVSP